MAIFRTLDVLWGINQACSETAHQLRISHLYQLRKDKRSFRERAAAVFLSLAALLPTLTSMIDNTYLKVAWNITVIFLAGIYLMSARDKLLKRATQKEYEDIEKFVGVVRSSKANILKDYVYSYCNRHDVLYEMYWSVAETEREGIVHILGYYQTVFSKICGDLEALRKDEEGSLSQEDFEGLVGLIATCQARYRRLMKHIQERQT